jgi:hypothetical protein
VDGPTGVEGEGSTSLFVSSVETEVGGDEVAGGVVDGLERRDEGVDRWAERSKKSGS